MDTPALVSPYLEKFTIGSTIRLKIYTLLKETLT